jgi:hypothetical protein
MYRHEWKAYYTTPERKLMGEYIVHLSFLFGLEVFAFRYPYWAGTGIHSFL